MTTLFHASAEGNVPYTKEEEAEYYARQQNFIPDYKLTVQTYLDSNAYRLKYDSIMSAVSYAGDSNEVFNAEGTALKQWRSEVWLSHNSIIEQIAEGVLVAPSFEDFQAMLPTCPL